MSDGERATRTARSASAGTLLIVGSLLSGCASVGLPFGQGKEASPETTGSIATPQPQAYAAAIPSPTVDPSDWEAIRRTVAMALVTGENTSHNWVNPDTGSSGTITQTVEFGGGGDVRCRLFATTLNDFRGSRRFRGQVCQQTDGRWVLVRVTPDDAALI